MKVQQQKKNESAFSDFPSLNLPLVNTRWSSRSQMGAGPCCCHGFRCPGDSTLAANWWREPDRERLWLPLVLCFMPVQIYLAWHQKKNIYSEGQKKKKKKWSEDGRVVWVRRWLQPPVSKLEKERGGGCVLLLQMCYDVCSSVLHTWMHHFSFYTFLICVFLLYSVLKAVTTPHP